MFWQNTESWASQYTPDSWTYVGSGYDGGNDPVSGYAPYDFDTRQNSNPRTSARGNFKRYK